MSFCGNCNTIDPPDEFVKAACSGDINKMMKLKKRYKMSLNVEDEKGRTAMQMASIHGHKNVVEFLIRDGADVNLSTTETGRTALHLASMNGRKSLVELLIKNKASVNITSKTGATALHLAAHQDQIEVMTVLLKNKAVLNKNNRAGQSPLQVAASQGKFKAVQFLLNNNASISQVDDDGNNALMEACLKGNKDIVSLLLKNGADKDLTNQDGKTAKDIANEKEHKDIVKMIDDDIIPKIDLSECYPMKIKPAGKGVVAILANFTEQLKGYNRDIERIRRFFEGELGYSQNNVKEYKDMCEDQFMANVREIQNHISKTEGVDRLFIFIMSHGDMSGTHMCQKGSRSEAEKQDGNHVSISLSRVIARFQPDKTPALKGHPKVFIIQKCNGSVNADADVVEEEEPSTDTLQCQASCPNTKSFVADSGSVYIQKLCEEFEKNYRTKDVEEMLTAINLSVKETKTQVKNSKGEIKNVSQMSRYSTTLTKKIRLYMT